jgi:hypothetical protein
MLRITDNLPFTCKICKKPNNTLSGLLNHVRKIHNCELEYYNKYVKKETDGTCKCRNNTKFISPKKGYEELCYNCKKEKRKNDKIDWAKNFKKIYGVRNPAQVKEIYDKIKTTNLDKYGCTCALHNEKILRNIKKNNIKKYGVEWPMQNPNILHKQQLNSLSKKKYKHTDLYYQSSYEFDFLEKYYGKFDIKRGPTIKYVFEKENKVYHPDFYIPALNLIVEIKSSYWQNKEKNSSQRLYTKKIYDYIMILDKNYDKFEQLLTTNKNYKDI